MQKSWQPQFCNNDLQIERDEVICESFYQMRELEITLPKFEGGKITIKRDLFWRPDAVCVLLFDPRQDVVVLVEQFRIGTIDHPHSPWLLELVAGVVDEGETLEGVARRESIEEAGAEIERIEHLYRFSPSPGGAREYIDIFCAQVDAALLGGCHGLEEEGEDIKVHQFKTAEVFTMLSQGVIDNAPAIIALQWLQLHRERLIREWS